MDKLGWVIEAGNEPRYWTGRGAHDFSEWHEDAIRFARREDAEKAKQWICRNHALKVVEHLWVDVPLDETPEVVDNTPDGRYNS